MSTNLQPKTVLTNQLVMTKVVGISSIPNNMDNIVNVANDEVNDISSKLSDDINSAVSNEENNELSSELSSTENSEFNNAVSDRLNNVTTSLSANNEKAAKDSFDDKTNSSKPNLVKNYQNRNNSQRYENKPFRNNNRFNGNNSGNGGNGGNGKVNSNTNRSSNINNNSNDNTNNNSIPFDRSVDVVPSTFARIQQVYDQVCQNFIYRPNLGFVINAMIKTGKFDPQTIADNICTVFSKKKPRIDRKTPIYLTKENLEKCRETQAKVRLILGMDIDIHPVLNSMIYTGGFDPVSIANAVRRPFLDKTKNSSYQGSNSYQKSSSSSSYQKPGSYQKPKPYQKSKSIN